MSKPDPYEQFCKELEAAICQFRGTSTLGDVLNELETLAWGWKAKGFATLESERAHTECADAVLLTVLRARKGEI